MAKNPPPKDPNTGNRQYTCPICKQKILVIHDTGKEVGHDVTCPNL